MKNFVNQLKKGKYLSLLTACLVLFTYISDMRLYIYENITKAFTLGKLGAEWIDISVIVAVFLSIAVLVGILLIYLLRKKESLSMEILLYGVSAIASIVILLFNPFNFQLILPGQNLQNITSFNFIAVLVFSTILVAMLVFLIGRHLLFICKQFDYYSLIAVGIILFLSIVLSILTTVFNWSFPICVGVYSSVLLLANIIHALLKNDIVVDSSLGEVTNYKKIIIVGVVFIAAIVSVLIAAYFITEGAVKF